MLLRLTGINPGDLFAYPDGDEGDGEVDEEPGDSDQVAKIHNAVGDVPTFIQHRSNRLARVRLRQNVRHVPVQLKEKTDMNGRMKLLASSCIGKQDNIEDECCCYWKFLGEVICVITF